MPSFLDLPIELRLDVYAYTVHPDSASIALARLKYRPGHELRRACPPIMLVSRLINCEIVDWLLRSTVIMKTAHWERDDGVGELDEALHGPLLSKIRRLVVDVTILPRRPHVKLVHQLHRIWRRSCSLLCVKFEATSMSVRSPTQLDGAPQASDLTGFSSQVMSEALFHRLMVLWKKSNIDVRVIPAITTVVWSPEDMRSSLEWAATFGHIELVRTLYGLAILEDGLEQPMGSIVLLAASRNGHISIMKAMLKHPTLPVIPDHHARITLLCRAVQHGRLALTRWMLTEWPESESFADEDGMILLHHAAAQGHTRIANMLLQLHRSEILINARDQDGGTPLHWALESQKRAVIRLLLDDSRTNVNARDDGGITPLIYATSLGLFTETAMLLADPRIDAESRDNDGRTALSHACEQGHLKIAKLLLMNTATDAASVDTCHRSPLSYAAAMGHEPIIRLLLETRRVNPLAKGIFGASPLRYLLLWNTSAAVIRQMVRQVFGTLE